MGKDENKQYYSLDKVKVFKENKIEIVNKFKYKPSYIIETRNGLHVYWIINNTECNNDKFIECQKRLINEFNSDEVVFNPSRVMRLPGYNWVKDINNPFKCDIIEYIDGATYDIDDIISHLKVLNHTYNPFAIENKNTNKSKDKKGEHNRIINMSICSPLNPNIDFIVNNKHEELRELLKLNNEVIEFYNYQSFYDYITKDIDLKEYMGYGNVYGNFNCIFHDDNSPSANIFIGELNQWMYKCFSNKCNFLGNIIRCTSKLQKVNRVEAMEFIKKVYKLEIIETENIKKKKQIIDENKRVLNNGEFEKYYPTTYKIMKNYIPTLKELHDIAKDNLIDDNGKDDRIIFHASNRMLAEKLRVKSCSKVNTKVSLLTFLKLSTKLNEEQIPEQLLLSAKKYANKHNYKKITTFYSLIPYDDNHMEIVEERSKLYKDKNMTVKGWSREMLVRTFGENNPIINEVYPQSKGDKISKISDNITRIIHEYAINMINEYGYIKEKDVYISIYGDGKASKTMSEKQIKRCLQEMLDCYGWKRIRLNKELKEKYKYEGEGYPFIIVNE